MFLLSESLHQSITTLQHQIALDSDIGLHFYVPALTLMFPFTRNNTNDDNIRETSTSTTNKSIKANRAIKTGKTSTVCATKTLLTRSQTADIRLSSYFETKVSSSETGKPKKKKLELDDNWGSTTAADSTVIKMPVPCVCFERVYY